MHKHIANTGLCLLLLLMLLPFGLWAQPSGFAGSFTRLGFGPRGMAMGNALAASDNEGTYGYYNPALAAQQINNAQVDLSTALMSFDRSLHSINASFSLPPDAGLNIALHTAGVDNIDGRTSSGYFTEELSTREYQLLTALGIRFHEKVSAGVGIKLNLADYHPDLSNAKGVGFDIGILYKWNESISVGITAQDLLASYGWNSAELYGGESSGDDNEDFPARYTVGIANQFKQHILLSVSYSMMRHESQVYHQLRLGGSWKVHERLSIRAGWQVEDLEQLKISNRPGAGFSIHLPFDSLRPSVDYAFLLEPNQISSMHVFGLKLNL